MAVGAPDASGVSSRRRVRWTIAAALLAAVGIVAVVLAAASVARDPSDQARWTFTTTSTQIASTLQLSTPAGGGCAACSMDFRETDAGTTNSQPRNAQQQRSEDRKVMNGYRQ